MNWVTNELLKKHGFKRVKRRIETVICKSIFTPLGDLQFIQLFDRVNSLFSLTRFPDEDDSTLENSVILDIANEEELITLLNILKVPS